VEDLVAAYQAAADRMEILRWSVAEVFAEREDWLWDELDALARRRGLTPPARRPSATAAPVPGDGYGHTPGIRRDYRLLAERLARQAHRPGWDAGAPPDAEERALWAALWALAARRGLVEGAAPELQPGEADAPHHAVPDTPATAAARADGPRAEGRVVLRLEDDGRLTIAVGAGWLRAARAAHASALQGTLSAPGVGTIPVTIDLASEQPAPPA
jgi:hypothetical protein